VGAGTGEGGAIEIGRNEFWGTVFVGDETIKCVDSSFYTWCWLNGSGGELEIRGS